MERRTHKGTVRVEKRNDDGPATITGYAAVFYRAEDAGTEFELYSDLAERIMPGAFDRALGERDDVRALFNHDANHLLGRSSSGTLSLSVDERGLRYEIQVDPDDADHASVLRKIDRGDLDGSSFAFKVTDQRFNDDATVREIRGVELFDVGPVTFPAYESTTAAARSGDCDDALKARDQWRAGKAAEFKARARALAVKMET